MLIPGTQLHVLTLIIILLELMTLPFVWWYYYTWPKDKSRLWYLILLVLLILYNLTGGLFPDPKIRWISVPVQNTIAYGSGFLMASYFPWYFYKSFNLDGLQGHVRYGVPICLLLPYLYFFVLIYPMTGDLEAVINYGMVLPLLYSPVLLRGMLLSMRKKFRTNDQALYPYQKAEIRAVYWAVSPWVLMCLFAYLRISQWIEVLATNTGFIIITVLFMLRSGRRERMEKKRLAMLDERQKLDFMEYCGRFALSKREIEVAELHCQGLTYEQIAESLFIGKRTVDTYVQRIYFKTEVNKKIDLQKVLGYDLSPQNLKDNAYETDIR